MIRISAGTYVEDFPKITHNLTLQGVGGLAHLMPLGSPTNGEGILVVDAAAVTLDRLELSGASVPDGNGAGVRFETGTSLTITNSWLHDNQDGLLANGVAGATITVANSEFNDNGTNNGQTHNLYVNAVGRLVVTASYFHDALGGHEIKSRAMKTVIAGNRVADGPASSTSYSIDLPDGGIATVSGNVIEKGANSPNSSLIHFGGELFPVYPASSLTVAGNVVINDRPGTPNFVLNDSQDSTGAVIPARVSGNRFYGLDPAQLGGGVVPHGNMFPGGPAPVVDTSHPFGIACFVAGTLIAVPGGDTPVERLRIGDIVTTSSGPRAVKWLGRRRYTAAKIAVHPQLRPVLIRANAIANGLPRRDLFVSALHAVRAGGLLLPAVSLQNGLSVLRCSLVRTVSYVHVELDAHELILAEGLPVETFIDGGCRLLFDNADEYFHLYQDTSRPAPLPRVEEGRASEMMRRRVAARAGAVLPRPRGGQLVGHVERLRDGVLRGWAFDADLPGAPVELEVRAGRFTALALANRYRADLDHLGLADGRAGFTVAMPPFVSTLDEVLVRRAADGVQLPAAKPEQSAP